MNLRSLAPQPCQWPCLKPRIIQKSFTLWCWILATRTFAVSAVAPGDAGCILCTTLAAICEANCSQCCLARLPAWPALAEHVPSHTHFCRTVSKGFDSSFSWQIPQLIRRLTVDATLDNALGNGLLTWSIHREVSVAFEESLLMALRWRENFVIYTWSMFSQTPTLNCS